MRFSRLELILLLLLIFITIFLRTYNLEKRLPFGWDQERDAEMAWQIIKMGKPTLIGPRVISDDAFYLGPIWYYLITPFYFLFDMDPLAMGAFMVILGVLTTLAVYFFTKYLLGVKQAIIISLIWASLGDVVAWNPLLIPLTTVVLLYFLSKIVDGEYKFIPYSLLLTGFALQLHFQAALFLPPFLLAIFFYIKKFNKYPIKSLSVGIILFLLTFLPLIIFDLRHDFLNIKGFIKLFFNPVENDIYFISKLVLLWNKFIQTCMFFIPNIYEFNAKLLLGIIVFLISVTGLLISKLSNEKKILMIALIIFPPLVYSFYKGEISEYYFTLTSIPLLIGLSNGLLKIKMLKLNYLLIFTVLIWITSSRLTLVLSKEDYQSLYYKKQVVKYLVNQKIDPIFNISYSVPANADVGFKYLFKFFGREPQNIPAGHLWTIVIPPNSENVSPLVSFGGIGIIRR